MKTAKRSRGRRGLGRYQVLLLPALALLMGAAVFLVWSFVKSETQVELEQPVYQYFMGQRTSYEAGTRMINGERTVIFEKDGKRNEGDPSPIYCEEDEALFLPGDMSWMDPTTDREWKVPAYSRLERDESGVWYCGERVRTLLSGGFLHDGNGTYLFLDPVMLKFNGRLYAMDAFGFYSSVHGACRIYRYDGDEMIVEDTLTEDASAVEAESGYLADLQTGIYTAVNGEQRLLVASPAVLSGIEERG